MSEVKVGALKSLADGGCQTVEANGQSIVLYRVADRVYATANACPHRGGPLGEGSLAGTVVTCPWHGWEFDVATGCMPNMTTPKLKTYPVRVENGDIFIEV